MQTTRAASRITAEQHVSTSGVAAQVAPGMLNKAELLSNNTPTCQQVHRLSR